MESSEEKKMAEKMLIRGGRKLRGTVDVQGAKNAALPVMAASILLKGGSLSLSTVQLIFFTFGVKQAKGWSHR